MITQWTSLIVITNVILSDPLQRSADGVCERRQPSCKHSAGAEWGQLCPIEPEHHSADRGDGERDRAGIRSRSGARRGHLLYWWESSKMQWDGCWRGFLLRRAQSDLIGPNSDTRLSIRRINTLASPVVVNCTTPYFIRGSHSTPETNNCSAVTSMQDVFAYRWRFPLMWHFMFMWHFCHITSVTTAGQLMSERWLY